MSARRAYPCQIQRWAKFALDSLRQRLPAGIPEEDSARRWRRQAPLPPFTAALLLFLAMAPLCALAQAPSPPPEAGAESSVGTGRRDMARFFLLQRMREELQLTDSQSLKVLDIVRAMDEERRTHRAALESIAEKIRALQGTESAPDAQFKDLVAQFQKEQARFETKLHELEQRVLDTLTPRQQAGFLLLKRKLLDHHGPGQGSPARPGEKQGRGKGRS